MLDHVLLDVIGGIRQSFESALLQRQAVEERFQVDVLLGDVSWETSYSLPGEETPPRVRADVGVDWPTWSQSAYRSWSIGEPPADQPEIVFELALRLQRLAKRPDPKTVVTALGPNRPSLASAVLERSGPTVEELRESDDAPSEWAIEITYEGTWPIEEEVLEHTDRLEALLRPLGSWVATTLVRLADLDLAFLPPDAEPSAD
jgi:hypothetical protein